MNLGDELVMQARIGVHAHGAKLQHREGLRHLTNPRLPETAPGLATSASSAARSRRTAGDSSRSSVALPSNVDGSLHVVAHCRLLTGRRSSAAKATFADVQLFR